MAAMFCWLVADRQLSEATTSVRVLVVMQASAAHTPASCMSILSIQSNPWPVAGLQAHRLASAQ